MYVCIYILNNVLIPSTGIQQIETIQRGQDDLNFSIKTNAPNCNTRLSKSDAKIFKFY